MRADGKNSEKSAGLLSIKNSEKHITVRRAVINKEQEETDNGED